MKKLIILLGAVILLGAGCAKISTNKLSNEQNQQPKQNSQSVLTNLDQQSECAQQAEKAMTVYKEKMSKTDYKSFQQQNHYNRSLNKCFVLISYDPVVSTSRIYSPENPTNYQDLLDAYENENLASCNFYLNRAPYNINTFADCWIDYKPVLYSQYSDFVKLKMESK